MESIIKFLVQSWSSIPIELIIIIGLVIAIYIVARYLTGQIKKQETLLEKRDKEKQEMIQVLLESDRILNELTNTVKNSTRDMTSNKDAILNSLSNKAEEIKLHISKLFLERSNEK